MKLNEFFSDLITQFFEKAFPKEMAEMRAEMKAELNSMIYGVRDMRLRLEESSKELRDAIAMAEESLEKAEKFRQESPRLDA